MEWRQQEAAIQKSTKTSIKSLTSISGTNSSEWIRRVLLVSIPLIVWVEFITKLTTDWSTNSQYEFGYFVPFFILYLLGRRWNCHPNASTLRSSRSATLVGLAILILLLPTQIIQEANPDWRPLNWFHASIVIILSLVPISIIGGWVWVRHFSFPFLLIFAALPWPLATEQTVLQGLSGAVTTVTVELLNIANIPALQRGNVIDLAAGSVGVADACSGIRSLAGTLMASLFFGEFFRLQALRRFILVIGACAVSFGLNLCRAFFLSWRAAVEGVESIERWHDPAGFTIFSISFASLWFIANLMVKGHLQNEPPAPATFKLPALPYKWIAACALWPLAILGITESWYRFHEGRRPESIAWNVRWPDESESFNSRKCRRKHAQFCAIRKGNRRLFIGMMAPRGKFSSFTGHQEDRLFSLQQCIDPRSAFQPLAISSSQKQDRFR